MITVTTIVIILMLTDSIKPIKIKPCKYLLVRKILKVLAYIGLFISIATISLILWELSRWKMFKIFLIIMELLEASFLTYYYWKKEKDVIFSFLYELTFIITSVIMIHTIK